MRQVIVLVVQRLVQVMGEDKQGLEVALQVMQRLKDGLQANTAIIGVRNSRRESRGRLDVRHKAVCHSAPFWRQAWTARL